MSASVNRREALGICAAALLAPAGGLYRRLYPQFELPDPLELSRHGGRPLSVYVSGARHVQSVADLLSRWERDYRLPTSLCVHQDSRKTAIGGGIVIDTPVGDVDGLAIFYGRGIWREDEILRAYTNGADLLTFDEVANCQPLWVELNKVST